MEKLQTVWLFLLLLIRFFLLFEVITCSPLSSSSQRLSQHFCISDEKAALLQFKRLFVLSVRERDYCRSSYPKTHFWNEGITASGDCCSWDGVKCDWSTGRVIELDLSCSQLYGTIPPNSTLFQLSHLRKLNLANNDFNGSRVPPAFGLSFPHLTHLDLSYSNFSGLIPLEISHLSRLISLKIAASSSLFGEQFILGFEPHAFKMLIENQTKLQTLSISNVNISSSIPEYIGNLSSLTRIDLESNGLYGEVPQGMFHLQNLQTLNVFDNDGLTGVLPKSNWSSSNSLQSLILPGLNFDSELPDSIASLTSLRSLILSKCGLFGFITPWLGNLTQISDLQLSANSFTGQVPHTLSKLKRLENLIIFDNNLEGEIPDAFGQLNKLDALELQGNKFHGEFPHWLTNLTQLADLNLHSNNLTGTIPSNINELQKLDYLYLQNNSIGGTIPTGLFAIPSLEYMGLSFNKLSGTIPSKVLQSSALHTILLNNNQLQGSIPESSFSHLTRLLILDLSNNNLSGTLEPLLFVNLKVLSHLDLSHNSLQGRLIPLLPLSMSNFFISHNKLVGDIPWSICNSSSRLANFDLSYNKLDGDIPTSICSWSVLEILNLAHNSLSGVIPKCISNSSSSLTVLNLGMNTLSGTIPWNFTQGNQLRSINLNENHLEGQVPRPLANCINLEVLDLGNNNINDTFPYWLQSLPELQVLVLRHNKFHSFLDLSKPNKVPAFPKLRIFDLSHNEFSGPLPTNYFLSLNAMRNVNRTQTALEYMGNRYYDDTVVITWKGVVFGFQRILTTLATIDFSGNKFEGHIPNAMGSLLGMQSLNLSSNILKGNIPSSLGNLTLLESLDLSSNQLSGVIPKELARITSLAVLNLSSNHLIGPIPRGFQFDTFENNSYGGNLGLCGPPLTKKCSDNGAPPDQTLTTVSHKKDEECLFDGFTWKSVLLGYGCGMIFGLGMGIVIFMTGNPKWLVTIVEEELLKLTKQTGKRRHSRGHRNGRGDVRELPSDTAKQISNTS